MTVTLEMEASGAGQKATHVQRFGRPNFSTANARVNLAADSGAVRTEPKAQGNWTSVRCWGFAGKCDQGPDLKRARPLSVALHVELPISRCRLGMRWPATRAASCSAADSGRTASARCGRIGSIMRAPSYASKHQEQFHYLDAFTGSPAGSFHFLTRDSPY